MPFKFKTGRRIPHGENPRAEHILRAAQHVFLRDGDTVYRTWHTTGRGVEQLGHVFGLIDVLPWGRQEQWQDSPAGWPQRPTYAGWAGAEEIARHSGEGSKLDR